MSPRLLLILGFVGILAVGCGPQFENALDIPADFIVPGPGPETLEVVSYNAFLRPKPISIRDVPECRGIEIGQWLADTTADVVTLQETWDGQAVSRMLEEVSDEFPFQVISAPEVSMRKQFTGGLSILSRWPIEDVRELTYTSCNAEDCRAAKGAVHATIQVSENERINVVTTHLNAGSNERDAEARREQLELLAEFIDEIDSDSGPIIITGDFNTDSVNDIGEYEDLLSILEVEDPTPDLETTLNCKTNVSCDTAPDPERLDYVLTQSEEDRIFLSDLEALPLETDACRSRVNYLSDHRALYATFETDF